MPEVLPFRGLRYAASRPPALSRLIAPPYDAVSPALRDALAARSPQNVIHVTLGQDLPGDGPAENRYVRAARLLASWRDDGTVRQDPEPSMYALEQSFTGPDGRQRVRRGITVACRLHAYGEGLVLPHEKTLSAPRRDRLELLKSIQANLSPVFALFPDERGDGVRAVEAAIEASGEPVSEADSDDGTHHRLWRVTDRAAIAAVHRVAAERTLVIADGHHRYESALAYRDLVDAERPGLPANAGHRFVLVTLCSMADPGLFVYPTHRLLSGVAALDLPRLVEGLARFFHVETLREDLRRAAGRAWAVAKLAEHAGRSTTFVMVSAADAKGRILTLRDDADMSGVPLPENVTLRDLDVTVLHAIVFQHLLGLSPGSQEQGENLRYEMDAGEVVNRTLAGEFQLGFLVNPTPMWQVEALAEAGETMPQKSTFFFPKVASGLVMRRIDEPVGS
ncbi:MAG: DUF1015 domain-containing protein [Anaeromyxobacteraceae bacterium]